MAIQPTPTTQPLPKRPKTVDTHCGECGAELHHGDCPVCDQWPEYEFDD